MKAIVTGSFDPMTVAHIELVDKACRMFETVYVVALVNADKKHMFTLDERKKFISLSLNDKKNVVIDAYDGLTADYMHSKGITKIIRGIRNENDFEYEEKLSKIMKEYDDDFETVFLEVDEKYSHISSTLVRDLLLKNETVKGLVSENSIDEIERAFKNK